VLVVNHLLESGHQEEMSRLHAAGVDTVVLPTEGIPTLSGTRDLHAGKDSRYERLARFCVWNEPMKRRMVELGVMPEGRVRVIGVPRFDFYHPPLSSTLATRRDLCVRLGLDPARPVLVWATNFCAVSASDRDPGFYARDWLKHGLDRVLGPVEAWVEADRKTRDTTAAAITRLLAEEPAYQLVIKPHPADDLAWFEAFAASLPAGRAAVLQEAYIWDVLPGADALLKRSCTTGVEAWIRGQHTVELMLEPANRYFSPEHASGSHAARTFDELRATVRAILDGAPVPEEMRAARERFIATWCYRNDGRSTERFLDIIDELDRERQAASRRPDRSVPAPSPKRMWRYRLLSADDYRLHDLRLYGLRGRRDAQGRSDKWYRERDGARWRERLRPLVEPVAIA
jgi:surface carbohydrate biosynthesis protein